MILRAAVFFFFFFHSTAGEDNCDAIGYEWFFYGYFFSRGSMIIIFVVRVSVRAGTRAILTRLRKRTNVRKISTFYTCFVFRAKFFPTNTSRHYRRVVNYFTASPLLLLLSFTKFTSDFVLEQPSTIKYVVVWIFYGMVVKTNGKDPRAIERVRMCTI